MESRYMKMEFKKITAFKDPVILFEQVLNNLMARLKHEEYLAHAQIANIVFGSGDSVHQSYLSVITSNFSQYIQYGKGLKYKFNLKLVEEDFPEFFGVPTTYTGIIDEMLQALKHEAKASMTNRQGKIIYVDRYEKINSNENFYYSLKLALEQDEKVGFYEGMQIKLALDKKRFYVTILDFDSIHSKLIIKASQDIDRYFRKAIRMRVVLDTTWMINKLSERLEEFPEDKYPVTKLLSKKWEPSNIETNVSFYRGILDSGQTEAVNKCISNDITAIWGPPGTGKSLTLSYLVLEFLKRKERTLVCSIANVAVDSILTNCLKTFNYYENDRENGGPLLYRDGKVIRLGYSSNPEIRDNPDIKVQSTKTFQLESKLAHTSRKLEAMDLADSEIAELKDLKLSIIEKLEEEKGRIVKNAKVVFATATKAVIDQFIYESDFDNLIIDEASMMSAPYLLALAKKMDKRIIIAGDFRQLGPIVISQSGLSRKWLKKDLFEFFGIDYHSEEFKHPSLCMIREQRRFHQSICGLINDQFYENLLVTKTENKNLVLYKQEPNPSKTVLFYDLGAHQEYKCERTPQHSRYNEYSANYIIDKIISPLQKHRLRTRFSIVIITPYSGQVNLITRKLKEKIQNDNFLDRVKCGTVHSFQGSQADLIIFDIVDDAEMKNGRLYWHEEGERLVNVAISRATGKLIFVGDIQAIISGAGNMNISGKTRIVLNKIAQHKI